MLCSFSHASMVSYRRMVPATHPVRHQTVRTGLIRCRLMARLAHNAPRAAQHPYSIGWRHHTGKRHNATHEWPNCTPSFAEIPDSWYAATAPLMGALPALQGEEQADVCVIGGGYTGLSTALHLRKKGMTLFCWRRSGLAGALQAGTADMGTGQLDQASIEKWLGSDAAKGLWKSPEAV